ncbi:SUKH-4 family immunity protein [Streptomyces sp. NPDC088763]|uniref:SUKH-4 family immunity protein n=1 Tax=Streptomyces sp. NPDC088763 TaxID=3365892 RepID=UPI003805951C
MTCGPWPPAVRGPGAVAVARRDCRLEGPRADRRVRGAGGPPPPESDGPFYLLGKWTGGQVLLDGGTGRLYRDTTGGSPDPVAGSSLTQFFATVRLYDEFRRTHFPYATDHKDAQDNLARWHEHIDPAASRAETWTLILEGYDFEDSTWDLASYGLEWI